MDRALRYGETEQAPTRHTPSHDAGTYGETSEAVDINAKGQVARDEQPTGGPDYGHAFVWELNAPRMVDPGMLRSSEVGSAAFAINERCIRASWDYEHANNDRTTVAGAPHLADSFDATSGSVVIESRLSVGGKSSEAVGVSTTVATYVVDTARRAYRRLARLRLGERQHHLGALPGGVYRAVAAINNHNQIVGTSGAKNGQTHAVLWTPRRDT